MNFECVVFVSDVYLEMQRKSKMIDSKVKFLTTWLILASPSSFIFLFCQRISHSLLQKDFDFTLKFIKGIFSARFKVYKMKEVIIITENISTVHLHFALLKLTSYDMMRGEKVVNQMFIFLKTWGPVCVLLPLFLLDSSNKLDSIWNCILLA